MHKNITKEEVRGRGEGDGGRGGVQEGGFLLR